MKEPEKRDIQKMLGDFGEQLRSQASVKESVLAQLKNSDVEAERVEQMATINSSSYLPKFKPGESKMFKHLSIAAAVLILVSASVVFLVLTSQTSLAQVVENIKAATSYSADIRTSRSNKESDTRHMVGKVYWQQPDTYRFDQTKVAPGETAFDIHTRRIFSSTKPGIEIDLTNKTFRRLPVFKGAKSPLLRLQQLVNFTNENSTRLEKKEIDGKLCNGFKIPIGEIDPNSGEGSVSLWIDPRNNLPAVVEFTMKNTGADEAMVFENIRWNGQFDPELFSADAPKDFTEIKQPEFNPERDLKEIVKALRSYADVTGGEYPKVEVIYGDVVRNELHAMDAADEYLEGNLGWAIMTVIMMRQEASYYGIEVDQNTPNKVLFRWKRVDGKVQVIYGNLESAIEEE